MHTGDIALALIAIACACLALAALLASLIDRAASSTGARTRPRSQAQDTPARPGILRQATALAPILAGALTCIAALLVLASGDTTTATFFPILPNLRLEVTAAPLGAAFWLLIGVPLLASGISDFEARRQDARARAMDNLLLLVLLALVSVGDGLSFLILWQSVLTLVLVPLVFQTESRVALGRIVALLMAGTSMLPVFLLLDAGCHTLRLAALRACGPHIDPAGQSLLFILILAASASMALLPRATGGAWADPPRLILAGAVPPYALLRILPAPGD